MDSGNRRQDDIMKPQPDRQQSSRQTTISNLPNEILIQILAYFHTRHLLPLSRLNHHFYELVARLHHARLIEASRLENHVMVLECYHPSVKTFTPTLFCDYVGTDGLLGNECEDDGETAGEGVRLNRLHGLYSRFKPNLYSRASRVPGMGEQAILAESRYRVQRPRTSSEITQAQASVTSASGAGEASGTADAQPDGDNILAHDLYLDSGELFSQLCTQASIIKIEPHRGLFLSISNVTDGVIRVWRQWLARQAAISAASDGNITSPTLPPSLNLEPDPNPDDLSINKVDLKGKVLESRKPPPHSVILWTDVLHENVGLKFRVVEKTVENAPVLTGPNDEPPVAYTLQYDELLVRTDSLLLSLEKSLAQQVTHTVPLQSFLSMHRRAKQQLLLQAGIDTSFLDAHLSPLSSPTIGDSSDLDPPVSGGGWNVFFDKAGVGLFGTLWGTSDTALDYLQGCLLVGAVMLAARIDRFMTRWGGGNQEEADDRV